MEFPCSDRQMAFCGGRYAPSNNGGQAGSPQYQNNIAINRRRTHAGLHSRNVESLQKRDNVKSGKMPTIKRCEAVNTCRNIQCRNLSKLPRVEALFHCSLPMIPK
jgi:hypothetical protein